MEIQTGKIAPGTMKYLSCKSVPLENLIVIMAEL